MLIEFKVANYRSIREEQTLSMVASNYSDELPQNLISCDHIPGLKGTKLVKAVALYGANASGKSNIVAALRFFAEFVRDSATKLQPGAPTGAQPFKLDPTCLTQPSKFEFTVVINGIRTLYGIEMTRERVTSEYLVAYPKGRPQMWFERDWDEEKGKHEWSDSTRHFKHDDGLHEKTRGNAAFVSVATQFNHTGASIIGTWMSEFCHILTLGDDGINAKSEIRFADLRSRLFPLMQRADLGIVGVNTRKLEDREKAEEYFRLILRNRVWEKMALGLESGATERGKRGTSKGSSVSLFDSLVTPEFSHRGKAAPVRLNYRDEESMGTRRFYELAADLDFLIIAGKLLPVDEIESSLHPLLVQNLLRQFFQREDNEAQIIFTTHNPLLLDQTLLRRDQIWFTEKDQEGATRLYPLTDFKPRKDESLVKGYLAGRYGGVPFIPEGLKL